MKPRDQLRNHSRFLVPILAGAMTLGVAGCDGDDGIGPEAEPLAITEMDVPDRAIFGAQESIPDAFNVTLTGGVGGVGRTPILAQSLRFTPNGIACGPVIAGEDLPGELVGDQCANTRTGTQVELPPDTAAGYYTYSFFGVDRANNVTGTQTRTLLVDDTPPAVTDILVPATLRGGTLATFAATLTDNLDLFTGSLFFRVDGLPIGTLSFQVEQPDLIDERFDLGDANTFATRARVAFTTPFIRSFAYSAPKAPADTLVIKNDPIEAAVFRARDAATNEVFAANPFAAGAFSVPGQTYAAVDSLGITATDTTLAVGETVTITAIVAGDQDLPEDLFQRVLFERVVDKGGGKDDPANATAVLLGVTPAVVTPVQEGGLTVLRYTFAFTPRSAGTFKIIAIGVDEDGDALRVPNAGQVLTLTVNAP